MNSVEQDIVKLLSSPHYDKLAAYKPPFDPFEVIGCNEIRYSRIISWLLKDPVNREFRQKFLLFGANNLKSFPEDLKEKLHEGMEETIKVELEYGDDQAGQIDVFVCLEELKFVIAIEVKVWAKERNNQISDYQDFLVRNFSHSDWKKVLIFLTPYGELPKTASKDNEINIKAPVLCMSWIEIADFIDECQGRGMEHDFRVQFGQHIRRSVMMEKEEREIVIDLLKEGDNKKTIDKIIDYYPSLGDPWNVNKFKEIVNNVLPDMYSENNKENLEITPYMSECVVRELKIQVPKWKEKNLPFTLMLYKYKNTAVRVLISDYEFGEYWEMSLKNFKENSKNVVGNFPKLRNWGCWRAVFDEEGDREEVLETLIEAEIYDDDFWEQVEKKLKFQLKKLLPAIKAYNGEG